MQFRYIPLETVDVKEKRREKQTQKIEILYIYVTSNLFDLMNHTHGLSQVVPLLHAIVNSLNQNLEINTLGKRAAGCPILKSQICEICH